MFWSADETDVIFQEHKRVGNQWAEIAKHPTLEGRTGTAVKNLFYSTVRRRDKAAQTSGQPKQDIYKFAAENAGMQSKSTEPGSTAEEAEEPKANQNASVRKVSAS